MCLSVARKLAYLGAGVALLWIIGYVKENGKQWVDGLLSVT